jgi:hypothetical protein
MTKTIKDNAEALRLIALAQEALAKATTSRHVEGAGLLQDAIRGLAVAGQRNKREGKPIRLDGPGIQAVRAVLASYAELLDLLPARTMYRCHRLTEQRIKREANANR